MNKEEIYIEPPKTNYIVLTTHLDNLELARYIEKIPDTYFATFPYIEHYKQLQQENKQLKKEIQELRTDYGNKAQVERDLLQLRIDKAIEYIDKHIVYECDDVISGMRFCSYHLYDFKKEELLEILKGE